MRGYLMEVYVCINVIAAKAQDVVVIVVVLVCAVVVVDQVFNQYKAY